MKYLLKIERDEIGRPKQCTLYFDLLSYINIERNKGKKLKLKA